MSHLQPAFATDVDLARACCMEYLSKLCAQSIHVLINPFHFNQYDNCFVHLNTHIDCFSLFFASLCRRSPSLRYSSQFTAARCGRGEQHAKAHHQRWMNAIQGQHLTTALSAKGGGVRGVPPADGKPEWSRFCAGLGLQNCLWNAVGFAFFSSVVAPTTYCIKCAGTLV